MGRSTRPRLDEQAAWTAVLTRDGHQDGQFVYAVTSTGVYCRPSCPSRRPRREHVAFYATPDAAETAGFRACLRCAPRATQAPPFAPIEKARAYLDAHLEEGVSLQQLSEVTGISLFHLQRRFKQVTGLTPRQYVAARRAELFKSELKKGRSVTEATYEAGYGSSSRVYESSNATLGMTPSAYRRGGAGVHIRYATTESPFGRMLVGVTERGICSVLLGEDDAALERALTDEYPLAQRERAPADLARTVDEVLGRLNGGKAQRDLPLDLQATDFTWRVWRALQEIPYGETRSYGDIARAIGAPKAVRAVAHACASNPAALVIPCHRVIGSTGALTGYRWGVERKRQVLAHEERRRDGKPRAGAPANARVSAATRAAAAVSAKAVRGVQATHATSAEHAGAKDVHAAESLPATAVHGVQATRAAHAGAKGAHATGSLPATAVHGVQATRAGHAGAKDVHAAESLPATAVHGVQATRAAQAGAKDAHAAHATSAAHTTLLSPRATASSAKQTAAR